MSYRAPSFLFNAHLETIYPSLIRRVTVAPYTRERIFTEDNDFLDLDWIRNGANRLVVISHGLEGNSQRAYVKGLAKAAVEHGFDVLAWNFRGCSGEINKQRRFYHSGATDDLHTVITHVLTTTQYDSIALTGFSLGGNLTLKYLGERTLHPRIRKAVVFSVPLDLHSSCEKISHPSNWIYARRFLNSLKMKVVQKNALYPDLDISSLKRIRTIKDFDERYTAPLHGYSSALEYYTQNSSLQFLKNIAIPTLVINAKNDPFLSDACFPLELLQDHAYVKMMVPIRGGHVGFAQFTSTGLYWSEEQAMRFLES